MAHSHGLKCSWVWAHCVWPETSCRWTDSTPKRNRRVQPVIDGHLYALRNLVERCFSKLKHSRRLATRYDKTADSYLGFILVASARLWIRHFVNRT